MITEDHLPEAAQDNAAAEIEAKIESLADWRGSILGRARALIREAAPQAVEEIKWRKPTNRAGVPVWSDHGMICTGEVYKAAVKLTFARGAALKDPSHLFNASLAGGTRRAIDFRDGDSIDEVAFKQLIGEAVKLNRSGQS